MTNKWTGFGALNILVSFTQVNSLYRHFDLKWPKTMRKILRVFSIFSLNVELAQVRVHTQMPCPAI